MPENTSPTSPQAPRETPTTSQPAQTAPDAGHVPMTEEFDRARWTLPPIVPVLIALAAVAVVVAVVAFVNRPAPNPSGSITKMLTAEQGDNTMVAVHLKFNNPGEKPLFIKSIKSELEGADGKKLSDMAAPAVDMARYLQGFPQLAEDKVEPLKEELKIPVGATQEGMVIFSFPVAKPAFDGRKSFTLRVDFYDRAPMVLKQ